MKKYIVHILLVVYLFKVYGSLALFNLDLISENAWVNIYYVVDAILFCSFTHLLKDKISPFIYSMSMAIFISRLITEVFNHGLEYWYELVSVIVITIVIYLVKKWHSQK